MSLFGIVCGMPGAITKRKQPSPYKLHIHRTMKCIPLSWLGLREVQTAAALVDPMYELMLAVRTRALDAALPQWPSIPVWLGLYRDHRSITHGLCNHLPSLIGMNGDDVQGLIDDGRMIGHYAQNHPEQFKKELLREYSPYQLRRYYEVGIRYQRIAYCKHLRQLRRDLRSNFAHEDSEDEDFGVALASSPAVYFYVRVVLPSMILLRTTPQKLLRQVRSGTTATKRLNAVENLVRLDPMAMQLSEIQSWINVPDGEVRLERERQVLHWRKQGLGHSNFSRTGFKAVMGAMIQTLVRRIGPYLDLHGQWHPTRMDARQVYDLFQAVAKDRAGKSHASDPDLGGDREFESWSRQLRRYSKCWDQLIPTIHGHKSH